jgi:hypothetical protein
MIAVCVIQIIYKIHSGKKLYGSLWQRHDRMHYLLFVRILPTATVKMINRIQINETYSLMKFSTLSLSLT